jgi:uncharacterized phage-associated protein
MAYSSLSVANAFLDLAERDSVPLSNMKLQKLLYFAQGHSLGVRGTALIEDDAEAWMYGPVFPAVYREFRHYGASPIQEKSVCPFESEDNDNNWPEVDDGDDQSLIEAVWQSYKDYSPIRLSEMSHVSDGPWYQVRKNGMKNGVISKQSIRDYFAALGKA